MRLPSRYCLVLAALGLLGGGARAQQYAFRHYGAEAGVPVAYAIAFDRAGSLLVGTNDGVVRFDGRSFEPVPLPVEGVVWRLTTAADGGVWGLTNDGALFRLAPDGTGERIPTPAPLRERLREQIWPIRLRTDGRGRLWLSGGEAAEPGEDPALYRWEPTRRAWTHLRVPGAERIADFFVVGDGDDGALVVAGRDRVGEVPLRGGRLGAPRWASLRAPMLFVRPHPTALAWVGATDGLFLLSRDGAARTVFDEGWVWPHAEPGVDPAGRLLCVLGRGYGTLMERFAPDGSVELSAGGTAGLRSVLPSQLAFDPEGALWMAHETGLTTLEEERAVSFPLTSDGGGIAYVNAMAGDPARSALWVSTYGGIFRLRGNRFVEQRNEQRVGSPRAPVVGADGGAAWAEFGGDGGWQGRSSRGDPPGGRAVLLVHDGPTGRYETDESGLWRVRAGRRVRLGPEFLPAAASSEDPAGRLWLGGEPGRLDVVWGDTLASACPACLPPSLRAALDTVNAHLDAGPVVADTYGRVWASSSEGGLAMVFQRPEGTWAYRLFEVEDGLLSRSIASLSISPDGRRLWLGTFRGIQGLRLGPGPPRLDSFVELRTRDGLEGERVNAVLEDADGMLWAALVPGKIHRLDWRALTARIPSPPVHVEWVEVNGRRVPEQARLRLSEGDGLGIGLWPQTYRQPLRVRLEYRLGVRDSSWTDLGAARRLAFAALPSGRYALDVRAIREGEAPGPMVQLALAVAPPFWRSVWFLALVALGLGLVAFAVHRAREGRRRAAEALRFRIATDLHDEMGSGLTKVSLYSELIRRTAEGTAGGDGHPEDDNARVAAWAARVGEQAGALSGSMRDVVWAIRPDEDDWESLELRMKDAAVALLAPRGIAVDMQGEVEGSPPALPPEVRQNVLLFFKEAVHNAAGHAAPTRVEVRWRLSRRALSLRIADDGRGFDPATARRGLGLTSFRRRAGVLGGTFTLTTAPGEGTRLSLDIPLGRRWPWQRRTATTGQDLSE